MVLLVEDKGMIDFDDFLRTQNGENIQFFVEHGYSPDPDGLLLELKTMAAPEDVTVRDTWEEFKRTVARCTEIVILSDGMEESQE